MYRNPYHKERPQSQNEQILAQSNKDNLSTSQLRTPLNIVMSYIDCDQRYTFINKPYPDYLSENALGKRDDEINFSQSARQLRDLKRRVITSGIGEKAVIPFRLSNGVRYYSISVEPLQDVNGGITGAACASLDITNHIHIVKEQNEIIDKLKYALADLKTLRGIISLCSFCKDVKNKKGVWQRIDAYISQNTEAQISHGICPDCMTEHYPDFAYGFNEK